jgi:hypothetical protein
VRHWPARTWAIEGCQGLGGRVALQLIADGAQVADVRLTSLHGIGASAAAGSWSARRCAHSAARSACTVRRAPGHCERADGVASLYQQLRGSLVIKCALGSVAEVDCDRLATASLSEFPGPQVSGCNSTLRIARRGKDVADRCLGAAGRLPFRSKGATTAPAAHRRTRNRAGATGWGIGRLTAAGAAGLRGRIAPRRRPVLDVRADRQGRSPGNSVLLLRRL